MSLQERSVLMQFSAGLPGQSRKDKRTTQEVKSEKGLGEHSGKWIKELFPTDALAEIKALHNAARDYHADKTFPFGVVDEESEEKPDSPERKIPTLASVGILPAPLIKEYGDTMRDFANKQGVLVEKFLARGQEFVDWAVQEHNGTFDAKNYPGCSVDASGRAVLDMDVWRKKMGRKFYLMTAPLPVPNAEQFTASITALLGVDVESVNIRVRDAALEAQRVLLRRMIDPVQHMASRLANKPCHCSACKGKSASSEKFNASLIENVAHIAALVPKMNLGNDPQIDAFAKEMEVLTRYNAEELRDDKATRAEAANKAEEMFKRLSGYGL